ncbi:MAG TPA: hypothetical protein DCS83_00820 [Prevotella sp.]|nr:hypothetical protein [Prevotella sp.]
MADLLINGKDAYATYGVRMGDSFLDVLQTSAPLKDYVTTDNRLENGVRYAKTTPKINERSLTLVFTIEGSTPSDFLTKKKAFENVLYAGDVSISVPLDGSDIYHLKYTGVSVTFARNIERTFAKMTASFKEPDPTNRT